MVAKALGAAMKKPSARDVALLLADIQAVRFGRFRLKDGRESPFYVDLRGVIGFPEALRRLGSWLAAAAKEIPHDCIAAIPYAGLPLGVAMSLAADKPLVYARKEAKNYGTERTVEGRFSPGQVALVVDDVITTGGAKLEAIAPLRATGLVVHHVLVVVDRRVGTENALAAEGIELRCLVTMRVLLRELREVGFLTSADYETSLRFLEGS